MDKHSRLKVFFGPHDRLQVNDATVQPSTPDAHVVVTLSELLDPLSDAINTDRKWLHDFRDDQVTISKDLHEVLRAYRRFRKSA